MAAKGKIGKVAASTILRKAKDSQKRQSERLACKGFKHSFKSKTAIEGKITSRRRSITRVPKWKAFTMEHIKLLINQVEENKEFLADDSNQSSDIQKTKIYIWGQIAHKLNR